MKNVVLKLVLLIVGIASSTLASYQGSTHYGPYEFAFYLKSVDYVEALTHCLAHRPDSAFLAEPKDPNLQFATEAAVTMDVDVWLGATDFSTEGEWLWLDGTEMSWYNWNHGQPNDKDHTENCLMMHASGLWYDDSCCDRLDGYVCQIPRWVKSTFRHSEFEIVQSPGTFWQAARGCYIKGARLVEVDDQWSETELRRTLEFGKDELWIAGIRSDVSKCLTITANSTEEYDCSVPKSAFICEKVAPHAFKVSEETVSTSVGSRVEIDCTAEGYPTPDVVWYKEGREISTQIKSMGKSKLLVENVKTDDSGRYLCYATNDVNAGKFEAKTFMEVIIEDIED